MKFSATEELPEVVVVETEAVGDDRGFFERTYCEREFASAGLNTRWVQQNHTLTRRVGTVRGLHYQADPSPEIKVVRCLSGKVLDVAVDVRPGSATFGSFVARELSSENRRSLYIPAGFAHGFQCLEDSCELLYLMSGFYVPELARGVHCEDPEIGIEWQFPVRGLSDRDHQLPPLSRVAEAS